MGRPTIVLDTMVVKDLAFLGSPEPPPYLPYHDTLIALRQAGYHIALADVAALELGTLLELEQSDRKPEYFDLDKMLDLLVGRSRMHVRSVSCRRICSTDQRVSELSPGNAQLFTERPE